MVNIQMSDVGELLRCSDRGYRKPLGIPTRQITSRSPMAKMRMTRYHVPFAY
jgi:hypothetical protein